MAKLCEICNLNKSIIKRPKTKQSVCKSCFFMVFEEEVHKTITDNNLFKRGDRVAIGASGGKDSTVLAYIMKTLNERYDYGLELFLLSIDEGISGYRDDSLETVKRNKEQYNMELVVLSYKDLYGWSMDEIVEAVGRKNNCTFCGVFRRQALDRGALIIGANQIITGHNADDIAETVLMNILRGDVARLARCTEIISNSDDLVSRSKPFKYTYEKEIVMYAYLNKLDYFATECTYSPNAYRGYARVFLKDLEAVRPSAILDIIYSGELLTIKNKVKMPTQSTCKRCGYMSSNDLCKACVLLQGLNSGLSAKSIGKNSHSLSSNGTENSNQIDSNADTASRLNNLSIEDKNDLTVHFDVLRSGLENIRKYQKDTQNCNSGNPCTSCPNNS
ncbi:Cytoplasmic tRNA 2-thiolation protein 1 [Smittium culicis]|uniref:Cytoplasmic tRNA 2-thiolation protein 1 n=1 Tax=Smittium culicis TaxID=133412 RepID=A0A1R1YQF1_9FUNG|nr:Cytoplasmic tRNA 2-thiolation protein 1 [Smittium culicis]